MLLGGRKEIRNQRRQARGGIRDQRQAAREAGTLDQFRDARKTSRQTARDNEKSQNKNNIPQNNSDVLLRYSGGPNSLLGVGQTTIKRYSNTADGLDFSKNPTFEGKYFVLNSAQIDERLSSKLEIKISDFRKGLASEGSKNILSISPDYSEYLNRIESRFNLGDPGRKNKNIIDYVSGALNPTDGTPIGALDKVTYYPLYSSSDPSKDKSLNDFVTFRIGIYDNKTPSNKVYIHFRALLDSMDDNYTAEWNAFKYMGRGENFYRYNGFTRTINLGWTVAAQSKQELIPMYQKLNFLASSLTPDYSDNGYMRGNLATLTVGGYLHEQPGIITSINYSVPQESPWEIGISNQNNSSIVTNNSDGTISEVNLGIDTSTKQLPHIIKVTGFQFIPIHKFVPRKQQNTYDPFTSKFGDERYIALRGDDNTSNYSPYDPIRVGSLEFGETTQLPGSIFNVKKDSDALDIKF